jgi:hypothetical protein
MKELIFSMRALLAWYKAAIVIIESKILEILICDNTNSVLNWWIEVFMCGGG